MIRDVSGDILNAVSICRECVVRVDKNNKTLDMDVRGETLQSKVDNMLSLYASFFSDDFVQFEVFEVSPGNIAVMVTKGNQSLRQTPFIECVLCTGFVFEIGNPDCPSNKDRTPTHKTHSMSGELSLQ